MNPSSCSWLFFCVVSVIALSDAAMGLSESQLAKSRTFDLSPFGTSISTWRARVSFSWSFSMPFESIPGGARISVPFVYDFNPGGRISAFRRSFKDHQSDHEDSRYSLLEEIETLFYPFGVTKHACMLRLLCESALYPRHAGGALGDVLMLMTTPFHVLEYLDKFVHEPSDYVLAQQDGRVYQNCSSYEESCSQHFFKVKHGDRGLSNWIYFTRQLNSRDASCAIPGYCRSTITIT